jgi:hypothetical protein
VHILNGGVQDSTWDSVGLFHCNVRRNDYDDDDDDNYNNNNFLLMVDCYCCITPLIDQNEDIPCLPISRNTSSRSSQLCAAVAVFLIFHIILPMNLSY